ncbi:major facilitator superfamily domain-containing protein [Lasiosphaeria miniovina]|uniref:Major facilitator superfamily domain-containing protein n=1 Tax=Lasiosphaeria miniovina TaxID=1954250 RepID=A0AA40ECZ6_9PEZI|nr:major facilitator superfamily domain-containing protein [Lasiosphaeria miniovina]KAK0733777.1 major facilitator superfamily domain-containing protein [Lasiosphaeria miniovina]
MIALTSTRQFVPLIPSIVAQRGGVTVDQVQMWTSVLISAYGGAFVAVSPLMPFLARKGLSLWAVLVAGLVCAGASLALLQLSSVLSLLVLARILQGLAGASIAGACSALISTAIDLNGGASVLSWVTPALIQSAAMAVAPAVSGVLHDYAGGETAVFRCAYVVIAVNVVLGLLVFVFARVPAANRANGRRRDDGPAAHESRAQNYGTVRLRGGGDMLMSGNSSRSSSPGLLSVSSRRSSVSSIHRDSPQPSPPGLRITTAVYGYLVVAFLGTALQSVLPIFVDKRFNWSTSAAGMMFVWLSGPAVLVGPLAGALSSRVTMTARYLAAAGFLACAPALMYLGRLPSGDSPAIQLAFLATLAGISVALGLCGDPLAREIRRVRARATRPFSAIDDDTSAGTHASNLPNLAHAWGSLTGPLVAGALASVCGWKTMTKSLGIVSALSGLLTLLFLQGWIGSSFGAAQNGSHAYDSDEESSPLLHDSAHDEPEQFTFPRGRPGGFFDTVGSSVNSNSPYNTRALSKSDDSSDAAREQGTSQYRAHRRQFSVDTFVDPSPSSSSKAASSSVSSDELFRARFQAAIDLPVGAVLRPRNAEERFVMREAPHAPATDPRLAAGRRYVLDMEQPSADGGKEMVKRHVIVFEEGQVPPGMLQRREHHTVSVNRRASGGDDNDEAAILAGKDDHTMRVAEETGATAEQAAFRDDSAARYVVVLLEKGDDDALASSEESR